MRFKHFGGVYMSSHKILFWIALIASNAFCVPFAKANVDVNALDEAIRVSENSKVHPYGVIPKYKHTTPEKACKNTIRHALKDYKRKEEGFINFLSLRYAPIGANNDPKGLNKNWVKNVKFHYLRLTNNKG